MSHPPRRPISSCWRRGEARWFEWTSSPVDKEVGHRMNESRRNEKVRREEGSRLPVGRRRRGSYSKRRVDRADQVRHWAYVGHWKPTDWSTSKSSFVRCCWRPVRVGGAAIGGWPPDHHRSSGGTRYRWHRGRNRPAPAAMLSVARRAAAAPSAGRWPSLDAIRRRSESRRCSLLHPVGWASPVPSLESEVVGLSPNPDVVWLPVKVGGRCTCPAAGGPEHEQRGRRRALDRMEEFWERRRDRWMPRPHPW